MDIKERAYNLIFQNKNEISQKEKEIIYNYNVLKEEQDKKYNEFRKEKELWANQN